MKELAGALLLIVAIASFDRWIASVANRHERGTRSALIDVRRVSLSRSSLAPLKVVGAWRLTSKDRGFGGVSALAIDGGAFLAITDSAGLIRFPKPSGGSIEAEISEVPQGPGNGRFKSHRDSEAIVRDPTGRGWWLAFERHHELWLYDPAFRRPLERIELPAQDWSSNSGIEGAAASGPHLLLFHELGEIALRLSARKVARTSVPASGRVSDAATLDDGSLVLVERNVTPFGFRNGLVLLEKRGPLFKVAQRYPLPLTPFDNVEALAAERLPGGAQRLWLMTDDNFQPPFRTLLIALDLPKEYDRGRLRR